MFFLLFVPHFRSISRSKKCQFVFSRAAFSPMSLEQDILVIVLRSQNLLILGSKKGVILDPFPKIDIMFLIGLYI